ncbi:class I SAM-dependent methyltransferase [Thermodesulfobacteriota bacterium]
MDGHRADRLEKLSEYLSENGILWTWLHVIFVVLRRLELGTFRLRGYIEHRFALPGTYYSGNNYRNWQAYDWSGLGEEWTASHQWKESLFDEVISKHATQGSDVLEIGCGAGRWSEKLLELSRRLVLVDISPNTMEICKSRFSGHDNVEYHVNDGSSLGFLADESIDFVFSFDVFTVVGSSDTARYLTECARVLKKGGVGIIHHSGEEGSQHGWSSVESGRFLNLLHKSGLVPITQIESWGDGYRLSDTHHGTLMTVFRR